MKPHQFRGGSTMAFIYRCMGDHMPRIKNIGSEVPAIQ
jgi:hypothetical protein